MTSCDSAPKQWFSIEEMELHYCAWRTIVDPECFAHHVCQNCRAQIYPLTFAVAREHTETIARDIIICNHCVSKIPPSCAIIVPPLESGIMIPSMFYEPIARARPPTVVVPSEPVQSRESNQTQTSHRASQSAEDACCAMITRPSGYGPIKSFMKMKPVTLIRGNTKRETLSRQMRINLYWTYMPEAIWKCKCCKIHDISIANFDVAHIIAHVNGGPMDLENLRPVCGICNNKCGTRNLLEFAREIRRMKPDKRLQYLLRAS